MRALMPKKAKLDKLAGEIVRSRGRCENDIDCHSQKVDASLHAKVLTWAHIVSRRYLNTRWDLDNAFCLCMACHQYFTYRPIEWEQFVIKKIGEERYNQLKQRSLVLLKPDYGLLHFKLSQTRKIMRKAGVL